MRFRNRSAAGAELAPLLAPLDLDDPVVLALPRGGVPVAFEVAIALDCPLDVLVARKVGAPGHPERGVGAIAEGGGRAVDEVALHALGLTAAELDAMVAAERHELARRVQRYRAGRPLPELARRDVVLVDDGLATGVTAEAALHSLAPARARRLVLAVPVGAPATLARLGAIADEVVSVISPTELRAVGLWYDDFDQTTDEEVLALLARAQETSRETAEQPPRAQPPQGHPGRLDPPQGG